jgi:photosystem II stability/assembly factor-like uncharacterized protein
MKKLQLLYLFLALIVAGVSSTAKAQTWEKLAALPYPVASMYFFTPQEGFVGTGRIIGFTPVPAKIYRTTNGGESWKEMQVPGGYSGGVMDIHMTDRAHGWAAVGRNLFSGAVWSTIDSGKTWQAHRTGQLGVGIRQNRSVVVAPDFFAGLNLSVDSGKSFTTIEPPGGHDAFMGVDFLDSLHGAITSYRANGKWLFTTDGGFTWEATTKTVECYSVYGVPGTNMFIAAPENNSDDPQKVTTVCRSTDYGKTWSDLVTLPFVTGGHITGSRGVLYVSNTFYACPSCNEKRQGLFHSLDTGRTWSWIGGPANHGDYRFAAVAENQYCRDVTVYAADDTGNVYKTIDQATGIQATIDSVDRRTVSVKSRDTVSISLNISAHFSLSQFDVDVVQFEVEFDSTALDPLLSEADHIIPPTGWGVCFSELVGKRLSTCIRRIDSVIPLHSPFSFGSVVFGVKKGAKDSTSIKLSNIYLFSTEDVRLVCVDTAQNIVHTALIDPTSTVHSVRMVSSLAVKAYPTPVRGGLLNVQCDHAHSATLELIDVLGAVKQRIELHEPSNAVITIQTGSLVSGPYYLRLSSGGEVVTERVMVDLR